jgi:hypothetical protein
MVLNHGLEICDNPHVHGRIDGDHRLCEFALGEIMAIDWISTLQEQAEFARQIADDVTQTLQIADLSAAQAARLFRVVEQGAQTFDRIIEDMGQHDIDDDLIEAAETIADVWTNLSVTTANKLRVMQGLAPIALPPEIAE